MADPLLTKSLLRSRSAQLADYLRGCIVHGELAEPLPSIRDWSVRIGVGHNTLEAALKLLDREGLVTVRPRQRVRLVSSGGKVSADAFSHRTIRWVYYGDPSYDSAIWAELFVAVSGRLSEYGIQIVVERCSSGRLRDLRNGGEKPNQLLLLATLGELERYQTWFAGFRRSALVIGLPRPGVGLPYVTVDVDSAIQHAVRYLSGRGFPRACLVMPAHSTRTPTEENFLRLCAQARPAMRGELFGLPSDLPQQWTALRHFVNRVQGRLGLVLIYPIATSLIMTALLRRGVEVPEQVELIPMNTMLHNVRVLPPPVYYPFPVDALARTIARAAVRYFQQGQVPRLSKQIALQPVKPG